MKLNTIYVLLALFFAQISTAQDGLPIYLDYFADNYYLLHPSMAGAAAHNQFRITARQQWFDDQDAPNLQTASINARVGEQSGIGAIFINDSNGFHSQTGGYVTYAHHLMFSRSEADLNQLSFGLSAGLIQSRLDETNFDPADFDPIIGNIIQSGSYFNVDTGVSYNFLNFSGHFTIKNLLFQNRALNDAGFESNNQRNYLLGATYAISGRGSARRGSDWTYEPGFLFQYRERTNEQNLDVNFKVYRRLNNNGSIYAGLSYRRSFDGAEFINGQEIDDQKLQYFTPVLGGTYKNFTLAYTFSYQTGTIRFENGGFHQITLGLDFLSGRSEPYSCNCPAVN